ncbi:DsbA family oxidoreductase [Novosphingobium sp.]|uniref:DsbA family oxidoreductase n=1 Tax=Novosphingobium sp. TaxID=1874826 RepID=UPI0025CCF1BE|nr:DsbA family oxidoreductase [Novosphingobium sp.]
MSSETTAPVRLTIDVWSDVMCPWCLIGWHQLQKGLALVAGEIEAEVRWRPFELNPDMPPEGEPQQAHVMRKYQRTQEQAAAGRVQMQRIAKDAGAVLAYTGTDGDDAPPAMMWNTFLAHKLLGLALDAGGPDVQTRLKLALFTAHFNERRNVSDPAVLLAIAEEAGLERAGCEAALADPAMSERVRAEEAHAWDLNISGVPAMLVSGKFLIPGAQEPEVCANALRRVVARGLHAPA